MPISTYARRILERVGIREIKDYEGWRALIESSLDRELYSYKYFFASMVAIGRALCRLKDPKCIGCPLRRICAYYSSNRKSKLLASEDL